MLRRIRGSRFYTRTMAFFLAFIMSTSLLTPVVAISAAEDFIVEGYDHIIEQEKDIITEPEEGQLPTIDDDENYLDDDKLHTNDDEEIVFNDGDDDEIPYVSGEEGDETGSPSEPTAPTPPVLPANVGIPSSGDLTVTFDANGGMPVDGHTSRQVPVGGTLGGFMPTITPTPPGGQAFWRWNTQPDGLGEWFNGQTVVWENITVYAIWGFAVNFDAEHLDITLPMNDDPSDPADYSTRIVPILGGQPGTVNGTSGVWPFDIGEPGAPPLPANALSFIGWFSTLFVQEVHGAPDVGRRFTGNTVIDGAITLFPRFEMRDPIRVDFDPTGGFEEEFYLARGAFSNHTLYRYAMPGVSIRDSWHDPYFLNRNAIPSTNVIQQGTPNNTLFDIVELTEEREAFLFGWWDRPGGPLGEPINGTIPIELNASQQLEARIDARSHIFYEDATFYAFYAHRVSFNLYLPTANFLYPLGNVNEVSVPAHVEPQYRTLRQSGMRRRVPASTSVYNREDFNIHVSQFRQTNPAAFLTGYTFLGWSICEHVDRVVEFSDLNKAREWFDELGTEFTIDTPIDTNMVVFAVWNRPPDRVHVTFDLQGGAYDPISPNIFIGNNPWSYVEGRLTTPGLIPGTSIRNSTFTTGGAREMPRQIPIKPGYVFVGWFLTPNPEGNVFVTTQAFPNETRRFSVAHAVNESITVYAHWLPAVTITFDRNIGNVNSNQPYFTQLVAEGFTWLGLSTVWNNSTAHQSINFLLAGQGTLTGFIPAVGDNNTGGFSVVNLNANRRWTRVKDVRGDYLRNDTVFGPDDFTVYARWYPANHTVTFSPNLNTEIQGALGTAPNQTRMVRHGQSLFNNDLNNPNYDGGNRPASLPVNNHLVPDSPLSLEAVGSLGWGLVGWNSDRFARHSTLTGWFDPNEARTGGRTYHAIWERGVTFHAGVRPFMLEAENRFRTFQGPGNPIADFPPPPTWEGFHFGGWFTVSGTHVDEETQLTQGGMTLFARWNIEVIFEAGEGRSLPGSRAVRPLLGGNLNSIQGFDSIRTNPVPGDVWNFAGEWRDINGNVVDGETRFDRNTTIYAQWDGVITFSLGCEEGLGPLAMRIESVWTRTIREFESINSQGLEMPQNPTREGYKFLGWFRDDGREWIADTKMVDGHETVYARWQAEGSEETVIPPVDEIVTPPTTPEEVTPPTTPEETTPPTTPEVTTPPTEPDEVTPPTTPEVTTPPEEPEEVAPPTDPGVTTPPTIPEVTVPSTDPEEEVDLPEVPEATAPPTEDVVAEDFLDEPGPPLEAVPYIGDFTEDQLIELGFDPEDFRNAIGIPAQEPRSEGLLTVEIVGLGTVDHPGGVIREGDVLTLRATPAEGWNFAGFEVVFTPNEASDSDYIGFRYALNGTSVTIVAGNGNVHVVAVFTNPTTGIPQQGSDNPATSDNHSSLGLVVSGIGLAISLAGLVLVKLSNRKSKLNVKPIDKF